MTTFAQNTKKTAAKTCVILLFILVSAAFCQAQSTAGASQIPELNVPGSVPIQSSAPALSGWVSSVGADMEMAIAVRNQMLVNYVPFMVAPATPTDMAISPAITGPEPSTLSLLLAGSAALIRFGWRKRFN